MVRAFCLGVLIALFAVPAFAAGASCAKTEYPPDVMRPGLFAAQPLVQQKKTLDAALFTYARYEADLKGYRDCITAAIKMTNLALQKAQQDNKDSEIQKAKAAGENLYRLWDASVDEETRVVNDMTALAKIYCARTSDPGMCRKFHL